MVAALNLWLEILEMTDTTDATEMTDTTDATEMTDMTGATGAIDMTDINDKSQPCHVRWALPTKRLQATCRDTPRQCPPYKSVDFIYAYLLTADCK
jgi:hypothetical protein